MPTIQYDGGSSPTGGPSSHMTLVCPNLTKTNQCTNMSMGDSKAVVSLKSPPSAWEATHKGCICGASGPACRQLHQSLLLPVTVGCCCSFREGLLSVVIFLAFSLHGFPEFYEPPSSLQKGVFNSVKRATQGKACVPPCVPLPGCLSNVPCLPLSPITGKVPSPPPTLSRCHPQGDGQQ